MENPQGIFHGDVHKPNNKETISEKEDDTIKSRPENVTASANEYVTRDENEKEFPLEPDAECKNDVENRKEYSRAPEKGNKDNPVQEEMSKNIEQTRNPDETENLSDDRKTKCVENTLGGVEKVFDETERGK